MSEHTTTIETVMAQQSPTQTGWICPTCRNHRGSLKCSKGVLICWTGANMSGCIYYIKERRKEAGNATT